MRRGWSALLGVMALAVFATESGQAMVAINRDAVRRKAGNPVNSAQVRVLSSAGAKAAVLNRDSAYVVQKHELLFVPSDEPVRVTQRGESRQYELPIHFLADPGGAASTGTEPVTLGLIAEVAGGGLRFRPEAGRFVGQLLVGLQNQQHPESSDALPTPVHLLVTADADNVDPSKLTIQNTNVSSVQPIKVEQIEAADSIRVHVRPDFDPRGADFWIPVRNSRVTLKSSPAQIQGFGLEVANLVATCPPGIRPDDQVIFTANRGAPVPGQAATGSRNVSASIRSRGTGIATVTAACPPFLSGVTNITFVWPVAFSVAAIVGGLLGGIAAHLRRVDKKRVQWPAYILSGAIAGVIVGIGYAAGISFLPPSVVVSTSVSEGLVFVISAVGAIAGVPALRSLVTKPRG